MGLRSRLLRWPVVAAAVVVLAGGGTAYAVGRGESGPHYRTVAATQGDVEQTLVGSGLVDAARRSDLSFGTDGTVASVKVAQGDAVKAGQVLATLDTAELDAAVIEARASLAQAIARLDADQDAQTSAVQDASDDQPTKPQDDGNESSADAALVKQLQAEQKAVLAAQSRASAALAAARSALAAQTRACADAYGGADGTAEPTPSPESDPTADPAPETADPAPEDEQDQKNAACDAALAEVQTRQATVDEAQQTLAKALAELTGTLTRALGSVTGPSASNARTAADVTTPSTDGTDGTDSTDNIDGGTVTAARLAADQAQIDQARADLVTAQAERAQATLRATRTGTVAALDLAEGASVSTGTTVATIVGGDAVTLTLSVPETSIDQVKVGQLARVSVPGQARTTAGRVTAIGMVADSSSGTTSYPVTVTVEDPAIALPAGSRAQVAIVTATAADVVTVPISAVTGNGDGTSGTVRVWDGETLERTAVTLGVRGSRTVQVTKGLEAGDRVVVADVDQAITGASDQVGNRGGIGPNGPVMEFRRDGGSGGGPVTFIAPGPGK